MADVAILRRLKALIAFRVFLVTVVLGSISLFEIGFEVFPFPAEVFHLIVVIYALSIVYSLFLGRVSSLHMAYVQLGLDSISVVTLIFLTGGIESWFSSLMLLVVIAAAIVLHRNAGYATAIGLSLLYGGLVDLQFYGLLPIPHNPLLTERDFLYNIFTHFIALYLTAYLIGHLAARLEKNRVDLEDLSLFNREVIENTPSGLFTTDLSGRVLTFNRAAEEITGIDRAEAYGRNISCIFPFLNALQERKRFEESIALKGQAKVIGMTLSKMRDTKGNDIGFIGIFQDLTEFKRMADEIKQKEKWATIGELSANIAHEIRNPLASLKGSIEMLREDRTTPEKKSKLMSIALSEMDRLSHVIGDFLTYSRPNILEVRRCDLRQILDKTSDLIMSSKQENIVLKKHYSGDLNIEADALKLEQVFLNLGLNAFDAMPDGGELDITANQLNGAVEVTFRDTGEGISAADREKIFYPFFTTKQAGTGLGLSIVHRIIDDHNGKITVDSALGRGTTVKLQIPIEHERDEG